MANGQATLSWGQCSSRRPSVRRWARLNSDVKLKPGRLKLAELKNITNWFLFDAAEFELHQDLSRVIETKFNSLD